MYVVNQEEITEEEIIRRLAGEFKISSFGLKSFESLKSGREVVFKFSFD